MKGIQASQQPPPATPSGGSSPTPGPSTQASATTTGGTPSTPTDVLYLKSKGTVARGQVSGRKFVVFAESQAVVEPVPSFPASPAELRKNLIEQGILVPHGDPLAMVKDHAFDSSSSSAAGVLMGRSANGCIEWKDKWGRTLKDLEASAGANPAS